GSDPGGTPTTELSFECSLDGALFEPCSSPETLSALTGGMHTFAVRAVDSGTLGETPNADQSPASYTWQVVAPPLTTITASVVEGEVSTTQDVTFNFIDQPGSTYECRLDPVEDPVPTPWETCASPKEYTGLTNGSHVFEVRATTLFDALEDPPASFEWEIDAPDAIAPDTLIELGPSDPATTTATSASFVFSGTDNLTAPIELTFECSLDGAAFEDCQSGIEYLGLSVGPHTFQVRAIDPLENVDETPASRSWTIAAGMTNTPTGTSVTVDLGDGASATFTEVTGGGVTSLTLPSGAPSLPAPYSSAGAIYFDVSTTATYVGDVTICLPYDAGALDEPHLIHSDDGEWVEVTTELDPANGIVCGIVGSLSPFGIAEAPGFSPETEIAQAPPNPTLETIENAAEVLFQFDSNELLADFECKVDAEEWSSCDTPYQHTATIGEHILLVRAHSTVTDAFDLTPAEYTWTVLARPDAIVDSGPEDQGAEPGIQNESRTATFHFSSDQMGSTFECRLTGEATGTEWEPCTSPKTYANLAVEEWTFEVQAINPAGHVSLLPAQFEWEIADLSPPNTTIHTGPDSPTSATSATFTFSADEPSTFECLLDGLLTTCNSGVTYTSLDPGAHTFEVLAIDTSENENRELEPAVWTWTVDTQAPAMNLLETPPASDPATSATF
ncbi:MAG TPA: hypothetical protein VGZ51_08245, partial [Actinomycetota bacterium]|nr:hypothetical protein [Actinomycetota bacterium]